MSSNGEVPFKIIKKRLVEGSALFFGVRILNQVLMLVNISLLARYLSLPDLGLFFLVRNTATMAAMFCNFGANQNSMKYIGQFFYSRPGIIPQLHQRITHVYLVTTLIVTFVLTAFWNFIGPGVFQAPTSIFDSMHLITLGVMLIHTLTLYQSTVLRSIDENLHSTLAIGTIHRFLFLVALIVLLFSGQKPWSVELVLLLWLATGLINILYNIYFTDIGMKKLGAEKIALDQECPSFTQLLKHSFTFGITSITAGIRGPVVVLIIGATLGKSAAGIFCPIQACAGILIFVLDSVNYVLPPILSGLYHSNKMKNIEAILRHMANFATIISLPTFVFFIFFGDWVLSILGGDKFLPYKWLLVILSINPMSRSLFGSPNVFLLMANRQKWMAKLNIAFSFFMFITIYFCGLMMDLYAVATCISIFFSLLFIILTFQVYKEFGIVTYIDINRMFGYPKYAVSIFLQEKTD